jgi:hypothetical protein
MTSTSVTKNANVQEGTKPIDVDDIDEEYEIEEDLY